MHRICCLTCLLWLLGLGESKSQIYRLDNPLDSTYDQERRKVLDSLMLKGMKKFQVPGAIVAIVHQNKYLYHQGYGLANQASGEPIHRDSTSFRIASITKTFTAIAAMQLVEQGKLNLNQEIGAYLPDRNFSFLKSEPFTMHQLLTHTAGFDISDIGDAARTPEEIISLEDLARYHMPKQAFEPGSVHAYSNFGFALAGYLIQLISEQPYEEFIQEQIFAKLGMNNSSLKQPLPRKLKQLQAVGHQYYKPIAEEFSNIVPAGGINSTAKDLSHYLLALLNQGKFNGQQILSPESLDQITSQQYGSQDTQFGIGYSFFEGNRMGRRSLEHGGSLPGFVSSLILIPETGTGIFVAQNSRKGAEGFCHTISTQVLNSLIKEKVNLHPLPSPFRNLSQAAKNYTGLYRQMNYPKHSFEKVYRLFGQYNAEFPVEYKGDNMLYFRNIPFVEVEKNLFQINDSVSTWKIQFLTNKTGRGTGFFNGIISYERINWYESHKVTQPAMLISLLILGLYSIGKSVSRIKLFFNKREKAKNQKTKGWNLWQIGTSWLLVLAMGGMLLSDLWYEQLTDFGIPFSLKFAILLATLGSISGILAPIVLLKLYNSRPRKSFELIFSTLVIFAIMISSAIYWQHNLVGFWF